MIEQIDTEYLTSFDKLLGNNDVGIGGFERARRVVVRNNDSDSTVLDSWLEYFAGMHQVGGKCSD